MCKTHGRFTHRDNVCDLSYLFIYMIYINTYMRKAYQEEEKAKRSVSCIKYNVPRINAYKKSLYSAGFRRLAHCLGESSTRYTFFRHDEQRLASLLLQRRNNSFVDVKANLCFRTLWCIFRSCSDGRFESREVLFGFS